jgi:hypothetical protein
VEKGCLPGLVKNVVDDLHGINQPVSGFEDSYRVPTGLHLRPTQPLFLLWLTDRWLPSIRPAVPTRLPTRETAGGRWCPPPIFQTFFGVFDDVFGRKNIVYLKMRFGRPLSVFWRNLRGDIQAFAG